MATTARPRRRRRCWLWVVLCLVVAVGADYLLYPRLAACRAPLGERARNGLWLRYTWYLGEHADDEHRQLGARLRSAGCRFVYPHLRHVDADGSLHFRDGCAARSLVDHLHREAPEVAVLAWVFVGRGRLGEVDLGAAEVRRQMVDEALWLVRDCGFDGVQWDVEPCPNGDPGLLRLLEETRAALAPGSLLGCCTYPWYPAPIPRWYGWAEDYFAQVAQRCDQLAVMDYDTATTLPRLYVWLTRQEVICVTRAAAGSSCHVVIGVPTYGRAGWSHNPWAENLKLALKGVREGLADRRATASALDGVAVFADYTTTPDEWATYQAWWQGGDDAAGKRPGTP